MVQYVVRHIFEGQKKSFAKIFYPLIEEKFLKIVVSDYYKVSAAICFISCFRDVTLPNFCLIGPRNYSFKAFKCCVNSVVVTLKAIFGSESWLTDTPRSEL